MRILLFCLFLLLQFSCKKAESFIAAQEFKNGDIIFQASTSGQSKAIQLATNSKYSHCGLLFNEGGTWYVYEAIQPVSMTPLDNWIKRGEGEHYVVKRLKDNQIVENNYEEFIAVAQKQFLKDYDPYFEWSDDKIYCSELVWKVYKEGTGLSIGEIEQLKDFDLSHPTVKQKLKERYGSNIPLNEKVISPAAIFESELLETVVSD